MRTPDDLTSLHALIGFPFDEGKIMTLVKENKLSVTDIQKIEHDQFCTTDFIETRLRVLVDEDGDVESFFIG